jgi:hypothetical protein
MPGGFRETGPAPKRSEERVRRNEPEVVTQKINVAELIQREITIPAPEPTWHPIARMIYDSLAESAQCVYYEPTDWAICYLMTDQLSQHLRPQVIAYDQENSKIVRAIRPMKGTDLAAFTKLWTNLLMTEVDRRRGGIEVERAIQLADLQADDATVTRVDFKTARNRSIGN